MVRGLVVVDIAVGIWRHNNLITKLCSRNTALTSAPRHNRCTLRYSTLQNLVPADNLSTTLGKPTLNTLHKVALKLVLVLKTLLLDALLAVRALFPRITRSLIAADMDILVREELKHLRKDIFDKLKGALLTCAEDILADTPASPNLIRTACTAELRIGCKCRNGVTRHLNLRDNIDISCSGISDNITHLILSKYATIAGIIVDLRAAISAHKGLVAICTDSRELRIALNLYTPTLILGKVPMELVTLVQGEDVDILFHLLDSKDMAADIEQATAILKVRLIANFDTTECHTALYSIRCSSNLQKAL